MKVLTVLWTLCLVRFCSAIWCCGKSKTSDDDNGVYGGSAENLRSPPTPVTTIPNTLDLAKPNESKVKVYKDSKNGVEHTTYDPKRGSKITSVVDGDRELWKSSGNEECVLAKFLSKGGNSPLLVLFLANGYVYFEKKADGWTSIKKEDYDKKLNEMRNYASPSATPQASQEAPDSTSESLKHTEQGPTTKSQYIPQLEPES
ncbi:signal peptide containing protein [Theileria equi strain WA]|uniref:Signal peptide containing protein n=1 Tax=Theileria equi strain WA TaxID=1537102 RepID=L1LF06_THEEQ|nr:signal peptide containing protein [Theileria equi strain WA]EKX73864.1 signal peptide containing protein [Theileria equi strain WA]|eukprot:XP_004833316.1 signal peptide containing protein [Theileria equi strain WA]